MFLPAQEYRRTKITIPEKLHDGLDGFVYGLSGRYKRRPQITKKLFLESEMIHEEGLKLRHISSDRLKNRLFEVKDHVRRGKKITDEILSQAFSCISEVASRTLNMRPYPVQVMGALIMHKGFLAEMATGEGKTLTATLPAIMEAWTGKPCHIITVNDYLARRDSEEMRKVYSFCDVSSGCVTGLMEPAERRRNYNHGIVYTTSKEIVADFLRDRLLIGDFHNHERRLIRARMQPSILNNAMLVQRGLYSAIIDEADSVLIDEAVTPLIISRTKENRELVEACCSAHRIAEGFFPGDDYKVDSKYKEITLTSKAYKKIDEHAGELPGIWRGKDRLTDLIQQALNAKEFYHRDKQYVIQEGKVMIVDEFTGRIMPNRTWRQGLHQAVEAKEGIEVTNPSETMARLSFQRFFRFFKKINGMTGTAREAAGEFWNIYKLNVLSIPTNRPCIREEHPDLIFPNIDKKWDAIVKEIEDVHATGRPVLVGTRNVRDSEKLAGFLYEKGLECNVLNAIRHQEEARIVAEAGDEGKITIATNMAGRGTDIKLGRRVAGLGGLHVIAVERHESGRIDRQLFGRCARQGDPGSSRAFMSIDDEIIQRFVPYALRRSLALAIEKESPAARIIAQKVLSYAQNAAQKMSYKQRRNVLQMDTWLDEALSFTGSSMKF